MASTTGSARRSRRSTEPTSHGNGGSEDYRAFPGVRQPVWRARYGLAPARGLGTTSADPNAADPWIPPDAHLSDHPARHGGDVGLHAPACGGTDGQAIQSGPRCRNRRRPARPLRDHRRHPRRHRGPARAPPRQPARLLRRSPPLRRAADRGRRHGRRLDLGGRVRRPVLRPARGRPLLGGLEIRLIPEQPVGRDGAISVPYAGRIQVAGRRPRTCRR